MLELCNPVARVQMGLSATSGDLRPPPPSSLVAGAEPSLPAPLEEQSSLSDLCFSPLCCLGLSSAPGSSFLSEAPFPVTNTQPTEMLVSVAF